MPRVGTALEYGLGDMQTQGYGGQLPANADPAAFGAETGRQAANLGQALGNVSQVAGAIAVDRRDGMAWATRASLKAENGLRDWMRQAQASGQPNITEAFNAQWKDYTTQVLDAAPNAYAREVLDGQLKELQPRFLASTQRLDVQARDDRNRGDLAGILDEASKAVEADPTALPSALGRIGAMVDAANLPDEQKGAIVKSAGRALANSAWRGRIAQDPAGALVGLSKNAPIAGLTTADRQALVEQANAAEVEADLRGRRDQRVGDQQNEQRRQDVRAEGDAALAKGELDPTWLRQNDGFLHADDAEWYRRSIVTGPPTSSDSRALAGLITSSVEGAAVGEDARQLLRDGRLTIEDYSNLAPIGMDAGARKLVDSLQAAADDSPWVLTGAIGDYLSWRKANPTAKPNEAEFKLKQIVADSTRTGWADFIKRNPPPPDLVGPPAQPDMKATEDALIARMKARHGDDWRKIEDDPEFQQAAVKLEQWRQKWAEMERANG
jgi:hypothetical protein